MKQLLSQLSLYHEWSAKVMLKRLSALPTGILNKEVVSSFTSINKTLFHLATAESIWWQRIQLLETITFPDEKMQENFEEMSKELLRISANWVDLVNQASETRLEHVFEYRNSKREAFKQPLYQVLIHVFNHQTYHYGQIVTLLRQQEIEKIPATDYILFVRSGGKI